MNSTISTRSTSLRLACWCLSVWGALVGLATAQERPPVRPITLQECFQLALTNNLDLRIERVRPMLSLADLDTAFASYDPSFSFGAQHNFSVSGGGLDQNKLPIPASKTDSDSLNSSLGGTALYGLQYTLSGQVAESYGFRPGEFDTTSGRIGLSLTQPLLKNFLIDTTRYNIAIARKTLKSSELSLRKKIMDTLLAVEQAYYDLISARETIKVQQKALQLAERTLAESKKRIQIGTLAKLDEKQAESQVAARQADLTAAQKAFATAQNNLKVLIFADYLAAHDSTLDPVEGLVAAPVTLDLQQSWTRSMAQRPDLLQARTDLDRQGLTLKYTRNQRLPQLDVTGSYGWGASGSDTREFSDAFGNFAEGSRPYYSVGASVSIPLMNRAARTRYRKEKLNSEQMALQLKKQEETALVQVDEAVNQVRSSHDSVESTRAARVYAEAALEAEEKKLESGKSTGFVVLQLQRDLTSARREEIRALADYNKALAQLSNAEGATLERHNVAITVK